MRISTIAVQFVLILQLNAADKARVPVALEGYIRDDNGKPVRGVLVSVSQGSYTTQGETAVVPLVFPRTAGVVVLDDPDVSKTHFGTILTSQRPTGTVTTCLRSFHPPGIPSRLVDIKGRTKTRWV
jgi:protocatechuate 3,4-dioxygenase beta subunit